MNNKKKKRKKKNAIFLNQYWGLNSGLYTWKAGNLSLEPFSLTCFLCWVFLR
jgi:homospermidine synthase